MAIKPRRKVINTQMKNITKVIKPKDRPKYRVCIGPKMEIYGFLYDCDPVISDSVYRNAVRKAEGCTFLHKICNDLWVIFGD
jgi:hypothetical protein